MEYKMIHTTAEGNPFIKYSSAETDKILVALSKSQEDFQPLKKSGKNPHFRSEYSTLADIFESCMPSLKKNKLSIHSCMCRINTKNFFVQTIIHTESGQFLSSSADMGTFDNIQTVGSKITYLRRYLLQPMLNLEGDMDTDDDGNAGQKADKPYEDNKFRWYTWNGKEEINTSDIVLWSKKLENLLDYIKENNRTKGIPTLLANKKSLDDAVAYLKDNPNEIVQRNINLATEILNA
tara:strand:+ start:4639 stop:5346 length:708 start_codon:yes stop_codon:yes gene_type:complete